MLEQYASTRNVQFILHEVFQISKLTNYDRYQDYDKAAFDMMVDAAKQLSDNHLYPTVREMDKKKAYYDSESGEVKVHPGLLEAIKAMAEGGWIGAYDDYEVNGQQAPFLLLSMANYLMYAANGNAAAYPFLTQGAAGLIRAFGSEALNEYYIPKMYSGEWQGTMALTEPQAGSSLTDITSSASPTDEGYYQIKGQKIYISGGDYEGIENVVHLTLAKVDGAPAGTKGISLFVVPKYREENGKFVSNDVTTAGIYGKMGQKNYVAAHLMFGEQDDCRGWIVGEEHSGLKYMFRMMNEARIATGLLSTGVASAAYYASLKYANERPQGRHPSNKDASAPPVLIIEHADVRRMLLQQKAIMEGSLSLLAQCSYYADLEQVETGEARDNAHLMLELLTPVAKSFPAEFGTQAVSAGLQVLGGAGYTDDFPLEQYYRDIRINSIYEGTTTIHGMDLLGRKMLMQNGKAVRLFSKEIQKVIMQAMELPALKPYAESLSKSAMAMQETAMHLMQLAMKEKPEVFLSDATLFLEFFSLITVSWQWLKQAIVAQAALDASPSEADARFYRSKLAAFKYFFEYELPKTRGLKTRLMSSNRVTLDTAPADLV